MKKILLILLILLIVGCDKQLTEEEKLKKVLSSNNYIIIDVRYDYEYNEGHLVDAINIPYESIDKNINIDKNKTILVYCKSGKRSKIAYDKLKELGYDVIDLGAYDKIDLKKE